MRLRRSYKVRAKYWHSRHHQWLHHNNWQNKWICLNNQVERLFSKYTLPHAAEYQITRRNTEILDVTLHSIIILIIIIICIIMYRLNTKWKEVWKKSSCAIVKIFSTTLPDASPNVSMWFRTMDSDTNPWFKTLTVSHYPWFRWTVT